MIARDPQHACKFADARAKELGYVKYRRVFSTNWPLELLARELKGVDRKGVEACNIRRRPYASMFPRDPHRPGGLGRGC